MLVSNSMRRIEHDLCLSVRNWLKHETIQRYGHIRVIRRRNYKCVCATLRKFRIQIVKVQRTRTKTWRGVKD